MPYPSLLGEGGVFTYATRDAINALISGLGILTQGNVFWVRPLTGSDNNDGSSPASAFQTLVFALSKATPNQNDLVLLCAESNTASKTTNYLAAGLDWNKDGVHLIGVNAGTLLGQRSRISNSATVAAFANLFTLSANNCVLAFLELYQGAGSNDPSAASTCLTVTGMRNRLVGCQISGVGDSTLNDTGSNDLTLSGSENLFQHCYIGLDTVLRSSALFGVNISAGARNTFEDCDFDCWTSSTSYAVIQVGTACDRWIKFKNCDFNAAANISSAAAPGEVFKITTMNGLVRVINPAATGITLLATGGNAYVKVVTFQAATTVQGIGQSAAAS